MRNGRLLSTIELAMPAVELAESVAAGEAARRRSSGPGCGFQSDVGQIDDQPPRLALAPRVEKSSGRSASSTTRVRAPWTPNRRPVTCGTCCADAGRTASPSASQAANIGNRARLASRVSQAERDGGRRVSHAPRGCEAKVRGERIGRARSPMLKLWCALGLSH